MTSRENLFSEETEEMISACLEGQTLDSRLSESFKQIGYCIIPSFVKVTTVARLNDEVDVFKPFHSKGFTTAYNASIDESFPRSHPRNRAQYTSSWVVSGREIQDSSLLWRIYRSRGIQTLLAAIAKVPRIYRFDDVDSAINVAIMHAGDELLWHYDQHDYVAIIGLEKSDIGGELELVPWLRRQKYPDDQMQDNFELLGKILNGHRRHVITLNLEPGDLCFFNGRLSLHRVAPVSGSSARRTAIFAFNKQSLKPEAEHLNAFRYGKAR
jgi:hypothetical protein